MFKGPGRPEDRIRDLKRTLTPMTIDSTKRIEVCNVLATSQATITNEVTGEEIQLEPYSIIILEPDINKAHFIDSNGRYIIGRINNRQTLSTVIELSSSEAKTFSKVRQNEAGDWELYSPSTMKSFTIALEDERVIIKDRTKNMRYVNAPEGTNFIGVRGDKRPSDGIPKGALVELVEMEETGEPIEHEFMGKATTTLVRYNDYVGHVLTNQLSKTNPNELEQDLLAVAGIPRTEDKEDEARLYDTPEQQRYIRLRKK